MATPEWRYIARRVSGDGLGDYLDWDLPLFDVSTTDVLSGPRRLNAKIPLPVARLQAADDKPLYDEWSTLIIADPIGGGDPETYLLVNSNLAGPEWTLECYGFSVYPKGMPYTESWYGIEVDPLDVFRRIWDHLQTQEGGNLGVVLDSTTSPVRIGTQLENVDFVTSEGERVQFEAGPKKLAWYVTDDLGKEQDTLAKETPFDYHEKSTWLNRDAGLLEMRIELEYPRRGKRRDDLRFVLGENFHTAPAVSRKGDDYANGVMVLGSGEGRDMVHTLIPGRRDGRLRRVATVSDKKANTVAKATALANTELARRLLIEDYSTVTITDHPHAPLGSWRVGDEILVESEDHWGSTQLWFRVLASNVTHGRANIAELTIQRADKAAA